LLYVLAACIFAAQMLNWPLPGGTSLHLVGGALAGIVLRPWLGELALVLVLVTQCLVFHDGGITALGYFLNLLKGLIEDGRTIIVATNDVNLASEIADYVHIISDGRIVGHGTPEDILTDAIVLKRARLDLPIIVEIWNSLGMVADKPPLRIRELVNKLGYFIKRQQVSTPGP